MDRSREFSGSLVDLRDQEAILKRHEALCPRKQNEGPDARSRSALFREKGLCKCRSQVSWLVDLPDFSGSSAPTFPTPLGESVASKELTFHIQWRDRAGFAPASLGAGTRVPASYDVLFSFQRSHSYGTRRHEVKRARFGVRARSPSVTDRPARSAQVRPLGSPPEPQRSAPARRSSRRRLRPRRCPATLSRCHGSTRSALPSHLDRCRRTAARHLPHLGATNRSDTAAPDDFGSEPRRPNGRQSRRPEKTADRARSMALSSCPLPRAPGPHSQHRRAHSAVKVRAPSPEPETEASPRQPEPSRSSIRASSSRLRNFRSVRTSESVQSGGSRQQRRPSRPRMQANQAGSGPAPGPVLPSFQSDWAPLPGAAPAPPNEGQAVGGRDRSPRSRPPRRASWLYRRPRRASLRHPR